MRKSPTSSVLSAFVRRHGPAMLAWTICLWGTACSWSSSALAEERIRLDRISLAEGLSQVSAQTIFQDRQGFIWIGTQDGLNRFDGYEVVVFKHDPEDPRSLVGNFIHTLFEDDDGKLWVLTQQPGGIHRYDPATETFRRFAVGPEDQPTMLPLPGVFHRDETGRIWYSTNLGVGRLDPATGETERFPIDPGDPEALGAVVSSFHRDRAGVLWLGTFGSGLHRYLPPSGEGPGRFERYRARALDPTSLGHDIVSTIFEDSRGDLWIGTQGGGVSRLVDREAGIFEVWNRDSPTPLPSNTVARFQPGLVLPLTNAISEDSHGALWVVTTGGLVRRRGDEVAVFLGTDERPNFFLMNPVAAITEDSWGDLWIATAGAGAVRWERDGDRFVHLRNDSADPFSLPGNQMTALLEDRAGVLWMGTSTGGAARYSRYAHKVKHYRRPPGSPVGLADNMVFALIQDRRGHVWLGTSSSLYRLDADRREVVERYFADPAGGPRNLGGAMVRGITEDAAGNIWVGTLGGGLAKIDPELGQVVERFTNRPKDPSSISSNQVFGIHEDRTEPGIFWLATVGGWNRFDSRTGVFRVFANIPGDPSTPAANFVRCTYEDDEGVLWLCTGGGISRFDRETETFTNFVRDPSDPDSLANNNVMDLWKDGRGTVWVATYGGGLDRLEPDTGKVRHLTHKNGLPSDSLYSLLPDDRGFLWISSNQGLIRLDPETLELKAFDVSDGLQSTEFNGRAFHKTEAGELLFGGVNGWNAFFPETVESNPHAPPVVLTDFKIFDASQRFDRALNFLEKITLSHKDRFFAFEFAALDYTDPGSNRYAYRLDGFDEDWVDAGPRRFAGYTNLDGGHYTFRVKAANADGLWNLEGTAVELVIVPPWWRTWWAYALYALGLLGAVSLFVRHKTLRHREEIRLHREESERQRLVAERLQQIDRMKDEFLANTSHELRTPLNGIIGLAESLLDGIAGPVTDAGRRNLAMIAGSGRRLAHLVDDILDFSKLKNHQIDLHIQAVSLREAAEIVLTLMGPLVRGKDVELRNRIPEDLPPVAGDENRLQQVLHNLLGNAVKFTDHGHVTVEAEVRGEEVVLEITDTGIGLPENKLEQVFEGFEQADASTAREHGGTGLGLTITRQLVELHGGSVHLEPGHEGKGLRAILVLPRWQGQTSGKAYERPLGTIRDGAGRRAFEEAVHSAAESGPVPEVAPVQEARLKGRVLIVDDEPVNLQVLHNILSLAGFEVVQAVNGIQAIELVEAGPTPDLVLLDVMMPRMTGFEVTRRLRERFSGNQLPILLVTAKNQVSDLMEGMASGANDYLSKPVSKNELLARIETHLSLSRAHSVEAEHRRKTEEFERARSIQLSMLPETPPALERFEIAVYLETATEVGGDYYDFFPQEEGAFYVVTGDATGHGISAGMMVSMTKSALKALEVQSPHVLLRQLNQVFRAVRVEHMKMALNVLQLRGDEVALASAAMPPVLVYRAAEGRVEEIMSSSLPLGSLPDLEYPLEVFELGRGDTMVLLSDGLPETWSEERGEPLGYDAIQACLESHGQRSSEDIRKALLRLGRDWRGDRPLDDDITLIVIKRRD